MRLPPTPDPVKEILSTPAWRDQVLAHLAPGGDDRDDTLGQPALGKDLGQAEGVEGGLGSRLGTTVHPANSAGASFTAR